MKLVFVAQDVDEKYEGLEKPSHITLEVMSIDDQGDYHLTEFTADVPYELASRLYYSTLEDEPNEELEEILDSILAALPLHFPDSPAL